jgi:hypothetical protein
VGFVINEQRLALFDTATARGSETLTLVQPDGYRGSEEARATSIANDLWHIRPPDPPRRTTPRA